MKNTELKSTMRQGFDMHTLTDALYGKGSGNSKQWNLFYPVIGGVKFDISGYYPTKGIPAGDVEMVWEHTGQRVSIAHEMLLSALERHADGRAEFARQQVEGNL